VERPSFSNAATLGDLLHSGVARLERTSGSARLDAELLLTRLLGISRVRLLTDLKEPCDKRLSEHFDEMVSRRERGEPIAYIIGEREFWGYIFHVTPHVLVPRPESELIVERGLILVNAKKEVSLLDLGVGSGCLSISLTKELLARGTRVSCDAVDISPKALAVARENARRLGVEREIRFIEGSWFDTPKENLSSYDLIVANPPYIDPTEQVPLDLSFEPSGALFSPEGGLKDVKAILSQSARFLKPGGAILCEVGAGKRAALPAMLAEWSGTFSWALLGDDSPLDRFTVIELTINKAGECRP